MDYYRAKINELTIDNHAAAGAIVHTFITRPKPQVEKQLGKLFGLIEIEDAHPKVQELIEVITSEISSEYYNSKSKNLSYSEDQKDAFLEQQFESMLQRVNLTIATFLQNEHIELNLEKVNIVIGVLADRFLVFTHVGKLNVFLFSYTKKKGYRIVNVLDAANTPLTSPNPLKIFSQTINGRLRQKDVLMIANNSLFDFFSVERIKKIVVEKSVVDSISDIENLIEQTGDNHNFGIVFAEVERTVTAAEPSEFPKEFDYAQAASKDSMKNLVDTQQKTESLLTPSFVPLIKKAFVSIKDSGSDVITKIKGINLIPRKSVIQLRRKEKQPKTHTSFNTPPAKTAEFPKSIPDKKLKGSMITSITSVLKSAGSAARNLISKIFTKLSLKSKIWLGVLLLVVIIFGVNIFWKGFDNKNIEHDQFFDEKIAEIELKKNESEASLIYRDENQARELLLEAYNSLQELNPRNPEQQDKVTSLSTDLTQLIDDLRNMTIIESFDNIVNFNTLNPEVDLSNFALAEESKITVYDKNSNSIYQANLEDQNVSVVFAGNDELPDAQFGITLDEDEYLFHDQSEFYIIDNNDLEDVSIVLPERATIVDSTIYNIRLYLLDNKREQVYRYGRSGNSFGSRSDWVRDNSTDLSSASSIAIDGFVYVLTDKGEVFRFERGRKTDFSLGVVDPVLESPSKLITPEESNYLYIFDPATNRIVVYDKNGDFIIQYSSDRLSDVKDIVIDEDNQLIYVLNSTELLSFTITHL